jgi:hypothetical protein
MSGVYRVECVGLFGGLRGQLAFGCAKEKQGKGLLLVNRGRYPSTKAATANLLILLEKYQFSTHS